MCDTKSLAEVVLTIESRLTLAARMIMGFSIGKGQ